MGRSHSTCIARRAWPLATVLVAAAALLALPSTAAAATTTRTTPPGMPPRGKVMLGMGGSATTPVEFGQLARAPHEVHLTSFNWRWDRDWDEALGALLRRGEQGSYRVMLHIGPGQSNGREGASPGAVSRGRADGYMLDISRVANRSGQVVYIRPPAEMNGHWSEWSAFDADGSRRDADHSTRSYRRAFVRIALIMRGGYVSTINRRLAANGMPRLRTSQRRLPRSNRVAMVWNPQGRGAPDVRGNQPKDYYPGRPWVDYVANDVYAQSGRAAWGDHEALYARYQAAHPFMVAEYAPWGYDDPAFVRRMFRWVAAHPRTVALMWFNGTSSHSPFTLADKRRSLAAYRTMAAASRYRCARLSPTRDRC